MKKIQIIVIVFITTFVLSFGAVYAITPIFSKKIGGPSKYIKPVANGVYVPDPQDPKTEKCPLNGSIQTKKSRDRWETRRPLGIMIENSVSARPQSGLSNADVVFEAVAEGGITRFLSVFYCEEAKIIGPVRSARVYFLDFIGGFGNYPLYAHVGGANTSGPADALGQIKDMGWAGYNDLNQFSIGFPVFWRDYDRLPNVATEHTMYTNTAKLWVFASKRGLGAKDKEGVLWSRGFEQWIFKDDPPENKRPDSLVVSFGFWDTQPQFNVKWKYNKQTNSFIRFVAGMPHIDKNTNKQISAKNIIVLFMDEAPANDGYEKGQHLLYGTIGKGKAMIIQDGAVYDGVWKKQDRETQIKIYNKSNQEVEFTRGKIWFEVLPTGNVVDIQ